MSYRFLKTFYHYPLSKKTASHKTAVEKETGKVPPLSSPILFLGHNWITDLKKRYSHCFRDRHGSQESLSSAIILRLASFCRFYFPISEPRCLHRLPLSPLPSVKSTRFLFTGFGFSYFILPQHHNKELLKLSGEQRSSVHPFPTHHHSWKSDPKFLTSSRTSLTILPSNSN